MISVELTTDYKKETIPKNCFNKNAIENYEVIRKNHIDDFSKYMNRVSFSLVGGGSQTEKMFQYGRYLLLSSSNEKSLTLAHLQGVWNDNVACQIGWTCDMHLDINTQMNYWLSLKVICLSATYLFSIG